MKRMLVMLALASFVVAAAGAQSAIVTLQNQEEATFFYVIDPPSLDGLSAGSPLLATKVAAFFAEAKIDTAFAELAPAAEAGLANLTEGTHLLVGVFALDGEADLPVRVISVEADSRVGDRFYAIFATPSELTVTRGMGRLASIVPSATSGDVLVVTAVTLPAITATEPDVASSTAGTGVAETAPAAISAAAAIPAPKLGQIASFASYDPVIFTKERLGDFAVLPIADSRGWKLTGTRIAGLSGVRDSTGLHIALSVPGGLSESVSYFFYIFSDRAVGETNALTLELLPRANGSRGACLLWRKDVRVPRLIGSVRSSPTTVALDFGPDELGALFSEVPYEDLTVDITAGWFDRALGTWEEFYYTTISASQIPSTR